MRYFIVTYYKKPDGQMDEVVALDTRVRNRHLTMASVILDFKEQQVLKASLMGTSIPQDWSKIYIYYQQHYAEIFSQLESLWPVARPDTFQAHDQ